jgi:hypothetical protein
MTSSDGTADANVGKEPRVGPGPSASSGAAPAPLNVLLQCRRCRVYFLAHGRNRLRRMFCDHRCAIKFWEETRPDRPPSALRAGWSRDHRKRVKSRAFRLLGGPVCRRCGSDFEPALEVNHRWGGGNREDLERRARGLPTGSGFYAAIASGRRDTADLDVLCRLCNALDYIERRFPELRAAWTVHWKGFGPGVTEKAPMKTGSRPVRSELPAR